MITPAETAILSNPLSGWNRKHLSRIEKIAAHYGITHHVTLYEAIPATLAACAQAGVKLLIVNAGDGTLDAVMRELREASPFAQEPALAILAGGTSNMTQRDLGVAGHPAAAIERLARALKAGKTHTVLRHPLKLEHGRDSPHYGFFLGVAAIPAAIRFARRRFHTRGLSGPFGELLVLLVLVFKLLSGRVGGDPILSPCRVTLLTAEETIERACVCGYVTTLDRLLLGLCAIKPQGRLGVFLLSYPYQRIFPTIGRLLLGRPLASGHGVDTLSAETLRLRVDSSYVLDGELFDPGGETTLTLSLAEPFRFVQP